MGLLKSTLNDMLIEFTMNDVIDNDDSKETFEDIIDEHCSGQDGLLKPAQNENAPKRRKRDSLFIKACDEYLRKQFDLKGVSPRLIISATFYCGAVILAIVFISILGWMHSEWILGGSVISIKKVLYWSAARVVIVFLLYISLFFSVFGILSTFWSDYRLLSNKSTESGEGEGKPGEGKPGEGKPGEGKPGEDSNSKSKKQHISVFVRKFYWYMLTNKPQVVWRLVISMGSVILFASACVDVASLADKSFEGPNGPNSKQRTYLFSPSLLGGDLAAPLLTIIEFPRGLKASIFPPANKEPSDDYSLSPEALNWARNAKKYQEEAKDTSSSELKALIEAKLKELPEIEALNGEPTEESAEGEPTEEKLARDKLREDKRHEAAITEVCRSHFDEWERTVIYAKVFYDVILCFPSLLIGLGVSFVVARKHRPDYSKASFKEFLETDNGPFRWKFFEIREASSQITSGGEEEITFSVKRNPGFVDPVDLTFAIPSGLKGVEVTKVQIPKDESEALGILTAATDATVGTHTIEVKGVSKSYSHQVTGESKFILEVVSPTPSDPPFEIREVSSQITVGGEKEITFSVERKAGFIDPVDLTFAIPSGLKGVAVTKVQIPKDESEALGILTAATDATVGKHTIEVKGVSKSYSHQVTGESKFILEVIDDGLDRIYLLGLNVIDVNDAKIQPLWRTCTELELMHDHPNANGNLPICFDDARAGFAFFIDLNFGQLAGVPRQMINDAVNKVKDRVFIILTGREEVLNREMQSADVEIAKSEVERITELFKQTLLESGVSVENIYDSWDHSRPTEDANNRLREFLTNKCKAISNTPDTSPAIIGKYKEALAFLKKHAQQSVKPQEWVTVFEEAMLDLYSVPSTDWKSVAENLCVDALNKGERIKTHVTEAAQKGKDLVVERTDPFFWIKLIIKKCIPSAFAEISPTDSEDESADERDDIDFSRTFYECIGIVILYEISCLPTDEFVTKFNKLFPRKLICPLQDEDQQRVVSELSESFEKEN